MRDTLSPMGEARSHIPKEALMINALSENLAHQVTGVWVSPVGHAAYAPHTGERSQSDELCRRT